jgi:hypothetical protein
MQCIDVRACFGIAKGQQKKRAGPSLASMASYPEAEDKTAPDWYLNLVLVF